MIKTKATNLPEANSSAVLPLLTIRNVADRLQVSARTIHRLVANGDLTVIRIGRSVRVSEQALKAFLTQDDQS